MNTSSVIAPPCPAVVPQARRSAASSATKRKFPLELGTLITSNNLAALCMMPLGADTEAERQQLLEIELNSTVLKTCRCFAQATRTGDYIALTGRDGYQANLITRRLHRVLAALLFAHMSKLVASLIPDTMMRPDQNGTWTMLDAILSTGEIRGWNYLTTLSIVQFPQRVRVTEALMDLAPHLGAPESLHLLRMGLTDHNITMDECLLDKSNPLFGLVVESRLIHLLSGITPAGEQTQAVLLRQSNRLIVMGASLDAVTEMARQTRETLSDAGFHFGEAEVCKDVREGSFLFGNFLIDFVTGQGRCRLDVSAYRDLEARLRHCYESRNPGAAAQLTLDQWANYFAPGLINRNVHPSEWERAEAIRRQIRGAFHAADFQWQSMEEPIDQICAQVSNRWNNFCWSRPKLSWLGTTVCEHRMNLYSRTAVSPNE